jgi:hypothetical protein
MNSIIIDDFVNVRNGDPYRLFPFGVIIKNGNRREITPEFARTIKLPHFSPPIKLGSHEDVTPAGGHIKALEVRADGLYAIPEYNDKGNQALLDGAYRYHSPEIIWEGGLENPTDGSIITAPLIMGDALLHTPHLGETASLYSVEIIESNKEQNMQADKFEVPVTVWDKLTAFIDSRIHPAEPVKVEVIPEDYAIAKQERDEYKAVIEQQKAEAALKEKVDKFETELNTIKVDPALAALLAGLADDAAQAVMKQFKAMSAQIDESALTGEKGTPADGIVDDPKAAFNSVVLSIVKDKGVNYNAAFEVAKVSHADLFKAWAK